MVGQDVKAEKSLGLKTAQFSRSMNPFNSDHESCCSQADIVFVGQLPDFFERRREDRVKFLADTIQIPTVILTILNPFEITDRHATGIGKNIRQDGDTTIKQSLVGICIDRTVGTLDDIFRFDSIDVFAGDHTTQRRGNQEITIQLKQFIVSD
jgi:hypothetical protein